MADHVLVRLFEQLPKRCIVLLEDIDSAGIKREEMKEGVPTEPAPMMRRTPIFDNATSFATPGPESRQQMMNMDAGPTRALSGSASGISLSCLLNVIDGPTSEEDRRLIMTTNAPESLTPPSSALGVSTCTFSTYHIPSSDSRLFHSAPSNGNQTVA
jgi:chaperone BCS1